MSQADKAQAFADLHRKGDPVVLFNIWDAGSARAVADAGAKALATGSWSVAGAQGYGDGEALPLDMLEMIVKRITATSDLPLSVDFEGAYAAGSCASRRSGSAPREPPPRKRACPSSSMPARTSS